MQKLRFYLNKELDKIMAEQFLDIKSAGIDFGSNILKTHPGLKSLKKNKQNQRKIIGAYFDRYYMNHKKEMTDKILKVRENWGMVENKYITVTEKYFEGFRFSKGMYIAYASIINCNPRFLETKTFQFFYKKSLPEAIHTIAHELTHFIFFDFVKKRAPQIKRRLSDEKLWDLSEIFNVILLKSPSYRDIINQTYVSPYPEHEKYLPSVSSVFYKSKSAKEFIEKSITILSRRR